MIITTSSSERPARIAPGRRGWSLYLSVLRRHAGAAVLYAVLLFIFFPLQYLLSSADERPDPLNRLVGCGGIFNDISRSALPVILLVAPVAFTLMQYAFLHQKKSTDFFHSLPVTRGNMLLIQYAASCTILLIPLAVGYAVCLGWGFMFHVPGFQPVQALLGMAVSIACVLGILSIAALCAVMTGTVFDNLIYTGAALFAVPVFLIALTSCLNRFLFGFHPFSWEDSIPLTSPAYILFDLADTCADYYSRFYYAADKQEPVNIPLAVTWKYLIAALAWLALAALLLAAAYTAYHSRKSEMAGKTGYDNALTFFVKILGTLAGGMWFVLLIHSVIPGGGALLFAAAAVAGGILACCIIECMMSRGFRTLWKNKWILIGGAAASGAAALALFTGGLGYEARVPSVSRVASVEIEFTDRYDFTRYSSNAVRQAIRGRAPIYRLYDLEESAVTLVREDARQLIHELHARIVADKDAEIDCGGGISLTYRLDNGMLVKRGYYGLTREAAELYNRLNACEEVKRQTHPVFSMNAADVRGVTLTNRLMMGATPLTLTEEQISALLEALRADMLAETYNDMENANALGYMILPPRLAGRMTDGDGRLRQDLDFPENKLIYENCYVLLTDRYSAALDLLREYGAMGFETVDVEKISAVYAEMDAYPYPDGVMSVLGPRRAAEFDWQRGPSEGAAGFTDPADINVLLDRVCYNRTDALVRLSYTDEEIRRTGGWDTSACLWLTIAAKDGSAIRQKLPVNPKSIPETLLRRLQPAFDAYWARPDSGGSLFDAVLRAVRDAGGE